jgi:hypothetical protein
MSLHKLSLGALLFSLVFVESYLSAEESISNSLNQFVGPLKLNNSLLANDSFFKNRIKPNDLFGWNQARVKLPLSPFDRDNLNGNKLNQPSGDLLVVGVPTQNGNKGAIWVIRVNLAGKIVWSREVSSETARLPLKSRRLFFGSAIEQYSIPSLDDNQVHLAVGSIGASGNVATILLNERGRFVRAVESNADKICEEKAGSFSGDLFGASINFLPEIDVDDDKSTATLAVSAIGQGTGHLFLVSINLLGIATDCKRVPLPESVNGFNPQFGLSIASASLQNDNNLNSAGNGERVIMVGSLIKDFYNSNLAKIKGALISIFRAKKSAEIEYVNEYRHTVSEASEFPTLPYALSRSFLVLEDVSLLNETQKPLFFLSVRQSGAPSSKSIIFKLNSDTLSVDAIYNLNRVLSRELSGVDSTVITSAEVFASRSTNVNSSKPNYFLSLGNSISSNYSPRLHFFNLQSLPSESESSLIGN